MVSVSHFQIAAAFKFNDFALRDGDHSFRGRLCGVWHFAPVRWLEYPLQLLLANGVGEGPPAIGILCVCWNPLGGLYKSGIARYPDRCDVNAYKDLCSVCWSRLYGFPLHFYTVFFCDFFTLAALNFFSHSSKMPQIGSFSLSGSYGLSPAASHENAGPQYSW